jgi:hypothetical protein
MAVKYTTVEGLWNFLGISETVLEYQAGDTPTRETIAAGTVTATTYYLDQKFFNPDTLILYVGATDTALTLTTDYTVDSDKGSITLTAAGVTAMGSSDLTGVYDYSTLKGLSYNESISFLERAEDFVEEEAETVFANQAAAAPVYQAHNDELGVGQGLSSSLYNTQTYPLIKLQTTVNGAFTLGDVTLTLTDASGFPETGTIFVDGNKVSYTAKSTNDLTVPNTTPTIADAATVRGEVVEVSTSPSGLAPSFVVLTPDTDYQVDYDTGDIQIMNRNYYANIDGLGYAQDGTAGRMRYNYFQAWHNIGQDATIPTSLVELCYMVASRTLLQSTVFRSQINQRDNFSPQQLGFSLKDIERRMAHFRCSRSRNV